MLDFIKKIMNRSKTSDDDSELLSGLNKHVSQINTEQHKKTLEEKTKNNLSIAEKIKKEKEEERERRKEEEEKSFNEIMEKSLKKKYVHVISTATNQKQESAICFSQGDSSRANEILVRYLKTKQGRDDKQAWFMLMDSYQISNQALAFEQLSSLYADLFKISPPAWEPFHVKKNHGTSGRNVLVLEGSPSNLSTHKTKDMIAAVKELKRSRFDFSRMILERTEEEVGGLYKLVDLMVKIKKLQFPILLMGETELVNCAIHGIKKKNYPGKLEWLLVLECLQWRGEERVFEELALLYAEHFDESPPGYEKWAVLAEKPKDEMQEIGDLDLPKIIDLPHIEKTIENIKMHQHQDKKEIKLDWSQVERMTYDAATYFASFLDKNSKDNQKIIMYKPHEIMMVLWETTGIFSQVKIQSKKSSRN